MFPDLDDNSPTIRMQAKDPACRGHCEGRSDRAAGTMQDRARARDSALDSPAIFAVAHDGTKGLYCTCCEDWLRKASLTDYAAFDAAARFSDDAMPENVRLYECPRCQYDVKLAKEIRAR